MLKIILLSLLITSLLSCKSSTNPDSSDDNKNKYPVNIIGKWAHTDNWSDEDTVTINSDSTFIHNYRRLMDDTNLIKIGKIKALNDSLFYLDCDSIRSYGNYTDGTIFFEGKTPEEYVAYTEDTLYAISSTEGEIRKRIFSSTFSYNMKKIE